MGQGPDAADQNQLVVLVDEEDHQKGVLKKLEAHSSGGILHRAFSVFVFNDKGETLLQKRAQQKYHSGGLWSNTCCSHPKPGEAVTDAAHRRLKEELGFDCELVKAFDFIYKTPVGNGLTEYEYDHVYFGTYNGPVHPDSSEVESVEWIPVDELANKIVENPSAYTEWLKMSFTRVLSLRENWKNVDKRSQRTSTLT
ncbi:MAG: isopentenyl-diphosphate Delta-isomerase [Thermoprotei archaeon]